MRGRVCLSCCLVPVDGICNTLTVVVVVTALLLLLECKSNPWQHCPRRWIQTHTHTHSRWCTDKRVCLDTDGRKRSRSGGGVDESKKKKNNISILCCCCWPGRPCSGEIYTRGTTKQTSAPVCVYTTANGWVRVDSEGAKTRTMPRTLFRLSLYETRDFWLVCPESPLLSWHSRGRKRRKVSMTGAWVRSRTAAAHCSLYIF